MANPATRDQIIAAQAKTIFKIMNKAMSAAASADDSADNGEMNIALSYLMDLVTLTDNVKTLAEATLTIEKIFKE
jgi:hypothetical protein